jgi:hypothetical protein
MVLSPVGLRPKRDCTANYRPVNINKPKLSKNNQRENGKNWSWVPDECLTPGRTGRLTAGRKITLTLTLFTESLASTERSNSR